MTRNAKRLKSEAAPSVFDFSSYNAGSTDRPTQSSSKVVVRRKERAQRRSHLAEQREIITRPANAQQPSFLTVAGLELLISTSISVELSSSLGYNHNLIFDPAPHASTSEIQQQHHNTGDR